MNEPRGMEFGEDDKPRSPETLRPRAVGSPLAMGASNKAAVTPAQPEPRITASLPQPAEQAEQTPLGAPTGDDATDAQTGLQRAMSGLRMAWPFFQKLLPLLDRQVVTTISNFLTPHPHHAPQVQVNLAPIEKNLTELQLRHTELSDQVAEQNSSLKRVEDRLELVREATDRNTLEQQELMEDLKAVGKKVNVIAVVAMVLLAISIAVNVVLFLHIQRVLP
ncbi:MAG TPA: hypothetical protein VHD85_02965 [Terracidiphilus sp.]|nr:hypothetical protein [Terracidiphilus sp.]